MDAILFSAFLYNKRTVPTKSLKNAKYIRGPLANTIGIFLEHHVSQNSRYRKSRYRNSHWTRGDCIWNKHLSCWNICLQSRYAKTTNLEAIRPVSHQNHNQKFTTLYINIKNSGLCPSFLWLTDERIASKFVVFAYYLVYTYHMS